MDAIIIDRNELKPDGTSYEFEGYLYGNTDVSFIWVELAPGEGPRLHKHAYGEVIIILEGQGTFIAGSTTLIGKAGQIVVLPPQTPHKFFNSGEGLLRQIDIHLARKFLTQWLED